MPSRRSLPDTPSELIVLALQDLEAAEKDPDVFVHMNIWHQPIRTIVDRYVANVPESVPASACAMCWAGTVMRESLGVPDGTSRCPAYFDEDTQQKLKAIDQFRRGNVIGALNLMNVSISGPNSTISAKDFSRAFGDGYRVVASHAADAAAFKEDMRRIAKDLAAIGL